MIIYITGYPPIDYLSDNYKQNQMPQIQPPLLLKKKSKITHGKVKIRKQPVVTASPNSAAKVMSYATMIEYLVMKLTSKNRSANIHFLFNSSPKVKNVSLKHKHLQI